MFKRILAPVDLAHLSKLGRALAVTADQAKRHKTPVTYVSVTGSSPTTIAHTPQEFREKLEAFAEQQASTYGIDASAHAVVSNDPAVDVDDALLKAVKDTESDLVIMASHQPGLVEYFWPSNGGKIASHSDASVFVVRDN